MHHYLDLTLNCAVQCCLFFLQLPVPCAYVRIIILYIVEYVQGLYYMNIWGRVHVCMIFHSGLDACMCVLQCPCLCVAAAMIDEER